MLGLFRRRQSRRTGKTVKMQNEPPDSTSIQPITYKTAALSYEAQAENGFDRHIARYTGQTVTVFVQGGGISGTGFTGVLISANDIYLKLITNIGPAPACPISNLCSYRRIDNSRFKLHPAGFFYKMSPWTFNSLGSVTYIPIVKITGFVHNTL